MVFVDRWSLFRSFSIRIGHLLITALWSFLAGGLYLELVFQAGLTVFENIMENGAFAPLILGNGLKIPSSNLSAIHNILLSTFFSAPDEHIWPSQGGHMLGSEDTPTPKKTKNKNKNQ